MKNEKIELTKNDLKHLLNSAVGNIKDYVMNNDRFINDWLNDNVLFCECEGEQDLIAGSGKCRICKKQVTY